MFDDNDDDVTYRTAKLSNSVKKKHKIRAIMPFKVIQGERGRYQSKYRMRLPIND